MKARLGGAVFWFVLVDFFKQRNKTSTNMEGFPCCRLFFKWKHLELPAKENILQNYIPICLVLEPYTLWLRKPCLVPEEWSHASVILHIHLQYFSAQVFRALVTSFLSFLFFSFLLPISHPPPPPPRTHTHTHPFIPRLHDIKKWNFQGSHI